MAKTVLSRLATFCWKETVSFLFGVGLLWVYQKIAATGILGEALRVFAAESYTPLWFIGYALFIGLIWVLWPLIEARFPAKQRVPIVTLAALLPGIVLLVLRIVSPNHQPVVASYSPSPAPAQTHRPAAQPRPKPTPLPTIRPTPTPITIYVTPTPTEVPVAVVTPRHPPRRTPEPLPAAAVTPQPSPSPVQNNGASSNNQSGGITFQGQNNGTINQNPQPDRRQVLQGLQNFYATGTDIQFRLASANTDQDVDRAASDLDRWYNAASVWIVQNMGAAAQRKFANGSAWLSRFYAAPSANHMTTEVSKRNDYLNRVGADLENLQYLMQNDTFDRP